MCGFVTSHTRTEHFAVWCGAYSPDWAQRRFPLAEGQFGMENAPLLVTVRPVTGIQVPAAVFAVLKSICIVYNICGLSILTGPQDLRI